MKIRNKWDCVTSGDWSYLTFNKLPRGGMENGIFSFQITALSVNEIFSWWEQRQSNGK